ncbi:hypothetical protein JCM17823_13540 [Halorubrum gandharaense]
MGNRVEDLERQVAELQAAVNGLTEELVEMKERVRQVEDAEEVGVETGAQPAPGPVETASDEATATAGDDAGAGGDAADTGDDVLVPEQEASTPDAEAAKKAEEGEESEDGESGDSDIIVA